MRSEEKDEAYDSLHPGRAPEAHYAKINSARHSRFPECVYFGGGTTAFETSQQLVVIYKKLRHNLDYSPEAY